MTSGNLIPERNREVVKIREFKDPRRLFGRDYSRRSRVQALRERGDSVRKIAGKVLAAPRRARVQYLTIALAR